MKTFEEALVVAVEIRPNEDMSLRERDALELADEIVTSELATRYIGDLVGLALHGTAMPSEEAVFPFLMSLALSCFAVGVRVGKEMEKEAVAV